MSGEINLMLTLLVLLQFKHLLADFVLQNAYILENRGKWGHPGGILHAAIHLAGSLIVLAALKVPAETIVYLLVFEGIVHYHIDWAKDNLGKRYILTPTTRAFWVLTGLDQFLHQVTYVVMIAWVLRLAA